jgi:hypothetical protein
MQTYISDRSGIAQRVSPDSGLQHLQAIEITLTLLGHQLT